MGKQLVIKGANFSANAIESDAYYLDLNYAVANRNNVVFSELMSDSNLFIEYDIQLTSMPEDAGIGMYIMGASNLPPRVKDGYFQLGAANLMIADLNRHVFKYEKIDGQTVTLSSEGETITRTSMTIEDGFSFIGYVGHETSFQCKIYSIKQYSDNTFDESKIIHNWVPKKRMPSGVIGLYDTVTEHFVTPTVGVLDE